MNDLDFGGDLRTALHRDAGLVGEPAPDLLDQLVRRRQHQRRQRMVLTGAVVAVVLVAAGIPVGVSLAAHSAPAPATQPAAPTPSPSQEAVPTTPEVKPSATSSEPSASSTPQVTSAAASSSAVVTDPPCDWAAMDAALPPDTAEHTYKLVLGDGELCDGAWAAAGYTQVNYVDGVPHPDGQAGIFHYVDGTWVWLDRYTSSSTTCDNPDMPRDVWERGCNVD